MTAFKIRGAVCLALVASLALADVDPALSYVTTLSPFGAHGSLPSCPYGDGRALTMMDDGTGGTVNGMVIVILADQDGEAIPVPCRLVIRRPRQWCRRQRPIVLKINTLHRSQ